MKPEKKNSRFKLDLLFFFLEFQDFVKAGKIGRWVGRSDIPCPTNRVNNDI